MTPKLDRDVIMALKITSIPKIIEVVQRRQMNETP